MKFAVVVFPGSNHDQELFHVIGNVMGQEVVELWHKETSLPEGLTTSDCIVLPGGYSYGDHLRSGAIARFSPIMEAVTAFAEAGGYVWGIGNGFQILCEAGLLPGVLLRNASEKFVCKNIFLKTLTQRSAITSRMNEGQVLKMPIAHAKGRFYADETTLDELESNEQILFKYCSENGAISLEANPNGAERNIAGICNANRNVFGLMAHPERAAEAILGNVNGRLFFESILEMVKLTEIA